MQAGEILSRYWWVMATAGVVSILFGLAALLWPGLTLFALVWLFGIYAFIQGVVHLIAMFRAIGQHDVWWTHLLLGLVGVVAGVVVVAYPGISTFALLWVIAIWALVLGVIEIIGAFTTGQWLLLVTGLLAILFGLLLFANPGAGAVGLVMVIGIFAIVRGVILLVEAIRAPTLTSRSM